LCAHYGCLFNLLSCCYRSSGRLFAMENSQLISVNFILFSTPTISLGLWLLIFVASGTLLGIFASSVIIANYRRKLNRALKKD